MLFIGKFLPGSWASAGMMMAVYGNKLLGRMVGRYGEWTRRLVYPNARRSIIELTLLEFMCN